MLPTCPVPGAGSSGPTTSRPRRSIATASTAATSTPATRRLPQEAAGGRGFALVQATVLLICGCGYGVKSVASRLFAVALLQSFRILNMRIKFT